MIVWKPAEGIPDLRMPGRLPCGPFRVPVADAASDMAMRTGLPRDDGDHRDRILKQCFLGGRLPREHLSPREAIGKGRLWIK